VVARVPVVQAVVSAAASRVATAAAAGSKNSGL
jgi:hypothetical protein